MTRDWLERRAGPDDLRQFWQSKEILLYSKSHVGAGVNFTFGNPFSGRCVKNELGVNRGSGEGSWKAFAGVQTRDTCGLDCHGGPGGGEMWLCCGYTLEAGSVGLGDGWTWGMKEGTEMRMSLRLLIQTGGRDPHFTEQMRPPGSPCSPVFLYYSISYSVMYL